MGPKTKSAHLLRWHYGDRVTTGQFSNSFPKHFSYLCEYAIRFDLSCSFCEYPFIFHCLHCSPSCFDPDSLLLAYLWLGLSWIDCISANKSFSSSKTSSRKPYTSSKQQERHKHSVEITINVSCWEEVRRCPHASMWGSKWGDCLQMVPSNCVLNHMLIPWVSEVIYYCDYLEFGNICMFLTSFDAHFCILCAQMVG